MPRGLKETDALEADLGPRERANRRAQAEMQQRTWPVTDAYATHAASQYVEVVREANVKEREIKEYIDHLASKEARSVPLRPVLPLAHVCIVPHRDSRAAPWARRLARKRSLHAPVWTCGLSARRDATPLREMKPFPVTPEPLCARLPQAKVLIDGVLDHHEAAAQLERAAAAKALTNEILARRQAKGELGPAAKLKTLELPGPPKGPRSDMPVPREKSVVSVVSQDEYDRHAAALQRMLSRPADDAELPDNLDHQSIHPW